jgi:valyl-tRNA synthetase
MAVGTDVILDPADLDASFAPGRNFANKLWNIGRLLLGHLDAATPRLAAIPHTELTLADRWILARADAAVASATEHYERFRLNDAAAAVYHFLWSELADWYVEAAKPRLYGTAEGSAAARSVAAHVFDLALRLLHPVMPFITETLWLRLPNRVPDESLMQAKWPEVAAWQVDTEAVANFEILQAAITALRLRRAIDKVPPGESRPAAVQHATPTALALFEANTAMIQRLAKVERLEVAAADARLVGETVMLGGVPTTFALLRTLTDPVAEQRRVAGEIERLSRLVTAQQGKLANESFVSRAPETVVAKERDKLSALNAEIDVLRGQLEG